MVARTLTTWSGGIVLAGALCLPASGEAQTLPMAPNGVVVPALPGAKPASVNPPVSGSPEEILRQMQQAQERLSGLNTLPPPPVRGVGTPTPAAAGATPSESVRAVAPVPPAPTVSDVHRAERRLARLKSEVHVDEVAASGVVTATAASHVRARIVFPYLESSIYEVYAAPERMTAIELAPGEHLTTENERPKAADTVQWMADAVTAGEGAEKRTIILVKPLVSGIETNLLIPTNKHVYDLLLRSESEAYMPLVGFSYPYEEAAATEAKLTAQIEAEAARTPLAVPPEKLMFRYRIEGSKVLWRPLRVFDDGTRTYLEMPPEMTSGEAPAFFVMEGTTPLLVNYRVKGDWYIVDRLFEHAQLRIGKKTAVDIYRGKT